MGNKSILVIGELLWDLLPGERKLGGAPANFAFRLYSFGLEVALVTRLGNDLLGKEARSVLNQHGLDTKNIQKDMDHPTGTVDVFFDENKNPDYIINPGVAYDFIEENPTLRDFAKRSDCIAYGTLAQRSTKSFETINSLIDNAPQAMKFCDINLRKDCWSESTVESSIRRADIVKLNQDEAKDIGNLFGFSFHNESDVAKQLVETFNLSLCLVTLEDKGGLVITQDKILYSPGYQVPMKDPLGAGDAFSAAFIHNYLNGSTIGDALVAGNRYGALVVNQTGAMQPIGEVEIEEFERNSKERIYDENYIEYQVD